MALRPRPSTFPPARPFLLVLKIVWFVIKIIFFEILASLRNKRDSQNCGEIPGFGKFKQGMETSIFLHFD
jgi:hypothetical protein